MEKISALTLGSPLEPAFQTAGVIPLAFQAQFLHHVDHNFDILLEGVMERIWFKPRWLKPLFVLLEKMGILISETGENIPTTMLVKAVREENEGAVHLWHRTFHFQKRRSFNTKVKYDAELQRVVDLVGPGLRLHLFWEAQFIAPDAFRLDVLGAYFKIAHQKIFLPAWLWPWLLGKETFIQHAEKDGQSIRINMCVTHPLFGELYGYSGFFTLKKVENTPTSL